MNEFWITMLNNLTLIGIAFLLYIISVLANIFASCYYNIKNLGETFNKEKLIDGLKKALFVGLATAFTSIVITSLPFVIKMFGIEIPSDVEFTFTIVTVFMLYFNGINKYTGEAIKTINNILNGNK